MTISGISTQVQTILDGTNSFETVLSAAPEESNDFAGFPSAAHYYSNTDNTYATVSQNRRSVHYTVELYIVPPGTVTQATLFTQAYALIDSIIQTFDESNDLNAETDFLRPVPGQLERIQTKDGDGLMMTINLICEKDVSFR